ncbi:MAG: hypothetical protein ACTHJ1_04615 [Bordetella sp.]|uniref:hypothetical protein n=1 Tax=Bordetella sp. TaxID=28081 RepID=UPI003F7C1B74
MVRDDIMVQLRIDKQAIIYPMRRTEKPNGPAGGSIRRPGRRQMQDRAQRAVFSVLA